MVCGADHARRRRRPHPRRWSPLRPRSSPPPTSSCSSRPRARRPAPPPTRRTTRSPLWLEVTDVAPVAVPHRIRGRAWVAGWLTPVPARPQLALPTPVATLTVPPGARPYGSPAGRSARPYRGRPVGSGRSSSEEFAAAFPDPLARLETEVLQHLARRAQRGEAGSCALLVGARGPRSGSRWRSTGSGCGSASPRPPAGRSTPASIPRPRRTSRTALRPPPALRFRPPDPGGEPRGARRPAGPATPRRAAPPRAWPGTVTPKAGA